MNQKISLDNNYHTVIATQYQFSQPKVKSTLTLSLQFVYIWWFITVNPVFMVDSGKFWGNIIVFKVIFTQSMNDYNIISMSHTDLAVDITVELECQIRH